MDVPKRLDGGNSLPWFQHIFHPCPADNIYLAFKDMPRKSRYLEIIVGMIKQCAGHKKNQRYNVKSI
jgi:hypothetical protein